MNEFCELVEEVVIVHSALHFVFGILAVDALAPVGLAEDAHLEAFAILLLAVRLLASASVDVPRVDVGDFRALHLAGSSLHFESLVFLWWWLALSEGLCSQALLLREEAMWASVLHLWLESHGIPVPNTPPGRSDLVGIVLQVGTILAEALFVAVSTLGEAFTVHFEAL